MSDTLIFATSYVGDFARRDLVKLWANVTTKLNPGVDILLIDSASPVDPRQFLGWEDYPGDGRSVYRFPDNIGHLNITGNDGWGRAFCKGIEIAIDGGYDFIAHLDSDLIFCKPVTPIVDKLRRSSVKVAMPMGHPYMFTETAVLFASVSYLRDIKFIERYNWSKPKNGKIPEVQCEEIFADELFCLPLRGMRNDANVITWQNFDRSFPYGLDFFTHSSDADLYERMLKKNGIVP